MHLSASQSRTHGPTRPRSSTMAASRQTGESSAGKATEACIAAWPADTAPNSIVCRSALTTRPVTHHDGGKIAGAVSVTSSWWPK
jgi:hypothetical protein